MKYLLFLLFPLFIYAQDSYPDTLVMLNGKTFPCYITDFNESAVKFIYANNVPELTVLYSVQRIVLAENGTVYQSDSGFLMDLDSIEAYLNIRREKLEQEQGSKEVQEAIPVLEKEEYHQIKYSKENNWSFGVLYIPYYSGKIYSYIRNINYPYTPQIISITNTETNMEAQFSYRLLQKLHVTFDIGFTSTFVEIRDETHVRNENPNYNYDTGYLDSKDLNIFTFNIGLKYYFTNFLNKNVSVYALAGLGKQIAFVDVKFETLFKEPQPGVINEDNMDEYLKDLNSPWHVNIGFGAEYFFNKSLSLFSNIRFYYSRVSAKYDSRNINNFQTQTNTSEYTSLEVVTRIGIGLNFYF